MTDDEADASPCPRCGAWVPDLDGFGVLYHSECGYCKHASIIGGVCSFCGSDKLLARVRAAGRAERERLGDE